MSAPSCHLKASGLSFAYPGAEPCLEGITLEVERGEIAAVLGRSASGKSTLLRLLAGVARSAEGELLLAAGPLDAKVGANFPNVGYLMQSPERQFFATTIREEIAFGPRKLGWNERRIDAEIRRALTGVGLPDEDSFLDRSPWSISLGEQRRVALASIVAFGPSLILLDEPVASLDVPARRMLSQTLRKRRERRDAIVVVGHDLEWMADLADSLYLLCERRLRRIDLSRADDRRDLERAGYPLPGKWRFFETGVAAFWSDALWRADVEALARRWRRR